jgi:hypothetical protein
VSFLQIASSGATITSTNYWDLPEARAGKLFVSCNAGAFRVLVPPVAESVIPDMATATQCVVSRGPWPERGLSDAIEILFDDGTSDPFALHLAVQSFYHLPTVEDVGDKWVLSVWKRGPTAPIKALERLCAYRVVESIPWLRPWKGGV